MNRAVLTLLSTAVFGLGTPGATTAATNPALPMRPWVSNSGLGGETAGATARRAFWLTDADIPTGPQRDDAPPSDVHAHAPAGGGYLPPAVNSQPEAFLPPPEASPCRAEAEMTPQGWRDVTICD